MLGRKPHFLLLLTISVKESLDHLHGLLLYSLYVGNWGRGDGMLTVEGPVWIPLGRYYGDMVVIFLYIKLALTSHCPQI